MTEARDTIVSTLLGDRMCDHCGYNLLGQPVVRETHYDMLIVRCPECGAVASLQEHPLLGRWAGRWAALLATVWFLVMLGFLVVSVAVVAGQASGVGRTASAPLALIIVQEQRAWLLERDRPDPMGAVNIGLDQAMYAYVDPNFQAALDADALMARHGGWRAVADWSALRAAVWSLLWITPIGCAWSVCLIHLRRRWLVLPLMIIITAAIAVVSMQSTGFGLIPFPGAWVASTCWPLVGCRVALIALIPMTLALAFGLAIGRPLARGLVRLLLPPRLRGPLAILWTAEGLPPPRRTAMTTRPAVTRSSSPAPSGDP